MLKNGTEIKYLIRHKQVKNKYTFQLTKNIFIMLLRHHFLKLSPKHNCSVDMCHPHAIRDNYNSNAIPKRGVITDKHDIKSSLYHKQLYVALIFINFQETLRKMILLNVLPSLYKEFIIIIIIVFNISKTCEINFRSISLIRGVS